MSAPRLLLKKMVLLGDSKYGDVFHNHVREVARISSMWSSEGDWSDERFLSTYNKRKDFNTLLIVHPDNISKIRENKLLPNSAVMSIEQEFKKSQKVVFAHKQDASTIFYVIAAPSYNGALTLVNRLAELNHGFSGVLQLP